MKKLIIIFFLLIMVGVGFYYGYHKSQTSSPFIPSNDLMSTTRQAVDLLSMEDFAGVENILDESAKKMMPREKIQNTWQTILAQHGAYKKLNVWGQKKENGYDTVYGMLEFEKGNLNVKVMFNNKELVSDLSLTPSEIKSIKLLPGNASDTTPAGIEMANRAKDFLKLLAIGDFAGAEIQCDPFSLNAFLPPDKLQGVWNPIVNKVGSLKELGNTRTETLQINKQDPKTNELSTDQINVIYVTCAFEKDTVEVKVTSNNRQLISGLEFPAIKQFNL